MQELIKIEKKVFADGSQQRAVDARELHEFLGVKSRFNVWISNRIKKYHFLENVDFVGFAKILAKPNSSNKGGRPSTDYAITLDMAKELAMVENNEKGRQARRYFIDCEKQLRQVALAPVQSNDTAQLSVSLLEGFKEQGKLLARMQMQEQRMDQMTVDHCMYDIKDLEKRISDLEKELKEMKGIVENYHSDIFSHFEKHNIKSTQQERINLSRKAAKLSNEQKFIVAKRKSEEYGYINVYHISILEQITDLFLKSKMT